MQELAADEYYRVAPLLAPIEYDTVFARAVIEKKQSGKVLVDNCNHPNVAFIYHKYGTGLLCGADEDGEFIEYIINLLLRNKSIAQKQIRITVYPDKWEKKLELILSNRLIKYTDFELNSSLGSDEINGKFDCLSKDHIIAWTRVKFVFIKEDFKNNLDHKEKIPKGYVLKEIDKKIFERITGSVIPSSFWDSAEDFHRNGMGFCLLKDDGTFVSTSFAAYIDSNQIDVGIETNPEYRGQGFGILTGASMIRYCLENNYEPIWGCRKDNLASFRLAQKLGFKEKIFHPTYWAIK